MQYFEKFYRTAGVLKTGQLRNPPILDLNKVELPRWTALHCTVNDPAILGFSVKNEPLLRSLDRARTVVTMFPVLNPELLSPKAYTVAVKPLEVIRDYVKQNPSVTRGDLQPGFLKKELSVLTYNYGVAIHGIKYQQSPLTHTYQFQNYFNTVFSTIGKYTQVPKPKNGVWINGLHNHIIVVDVPKVIPSIKVLNNYQKNPTSPSFADLLGDDSRMFIAQIYNWLGNVPSVLDHVPEDKLHLVNFLFCYRGSGLLINLDVLKGWVKPKVRPKIKPKHVARITGQVFELIKAEDLQKRLLIMLITFTTAVNSGITETNYTEEDLLGIEDLPVDDELDNLLDDDEDKTPDAKALAKQFVADTTESALDMVATISNSEHDKLGVVGKKKNTKEAVKIPSEDLEDIFVEQNDDIDAQLNELDKMAANNEVVADEVDEVAEAFVTIDYSDYVPNVRDPEKNFMAKVNAKADAGQLTAAEIRRWTSLSTKYKNIKDPYGSNLTLDEASTIKPEELLIPKETQLSKDIKGVFDKSYLQSSLDKMDRQYIDKVLHKDIMRMSICLQNAGYVIDNYEVRKVDTRLDSYDVHKVRIIPLDGKPSTLTFRLPRVSSNGTFKSGGNTCRLKKQRADIPIRKISYDKVALTSYHSKMFVSRTPRSAFDYSRWISNKITAIAVDETSNVIKDVSYLDCFNSELVAPTTYSALSRYFGRIVLENYELNFDHRRDETFFGKEVVAVAEKYRDKNVLIGKSKNTLLWMDYDNIIYEARNDSVRDIKAIGTIESLVGLDVNKAPVPYAELDIFSMEIPLVVVLSYHIGLGNLLRTIKANYRRVPKGNTLSLEPHEFSVKFQDQTLVFDRREKITALLMGGWNRYHAAIKDFSVYAFDKKDRFGNFFSQVKIERRVEAELETIRDLWIDPITEEELIRLKEPTDMIMLYLSATEKLTYDRFPNPMDSQYQRDRGYERMAGMVYSELLRSVRGHRARKFMRDATVDMNPEAVWYDVTDDETIALCEWSNPIHNCKEQEIVVYRGAGGRSSRSMTAEARMFHKSSIGRDSEATVDSGDVATVFYLTANPNYESVRGTCPPNNNGEPIQNSQAFGTSMLLAPGAEYDDFARRNFISVQNSRTTNFTGSMPLPVRSGYERVLPYRVDDIYATVSRQGGKVLTVTDKVISVEYDDGTTQEIELGLRYGVWSGKTMPHDVTTDLKAGQKFTVDTPIAWNKGFFTRDKLTGGLIYKAGALAFVVMVEDRDVWEDSSAIHADFVKKFVTRRVDDRDIIVSNVQEIRNLLQVGEIVQSDSILCTIYNATEGTKELYSHESIDTLREAMSDAPKANANGVITAIEVFYTGQIEDMSETLADVVRAADVKLYKLNKELKRPGTDGTVQVGDRPGGTKLDVNTVMIRVRILVEEEMDGGSKLVVAHQMKSVVGRKIVSILKTEHNQRIDLKFSQASFSNRIVESANFIGTTTTLLVHATRKTVAAWKGK